MDADDRCAETHALLPELALGVSDGAERARALEHVAGCADCRGALERFTSAADDLLLLAPSEETPPGFELGVLSAIDPPAPRRRRPLRRLAFAAAAVAAIVAVTAGGMSLAFRDDRRLADHYRATLREAHGTYFGARRLTDIAGRPGGVVYVYRGSPSWILVTVSPEHRGAIDRAELVTRDGRRMPIASFRLVAGTWGGSLPLDPGQVAAVHLLDTGGRPTLVGAF
jgi:hypothetical protein